MGAAEYVIRMCMIAMEYCTGMYSTVHPVCTVYGVHTHGLGLAYSELSLIFQLTQKGLSLTTNKRFTKHHLRINVW